MRIHGSDKNDDWSWWQPWLLYGLNCYHEKIKTLHLIILLQRQIQCPSPLHKLNPLGCFCTFKLMLNVFTIKLPTDLNIVPNFKQNYIQIIKKNAQIISKNRKTKYWTGVYCSQIWLQSMEVATTFFFHYSLAVKVKKQEHSYKQMFAQKCRTSYRFSNWIKVSSYKCTLQKFHKTDILWFWVVIC